MQGKKRILIVMGRYLPGYRTGGPVRSTKNLVDALGKEYDFGILCQDRDLGDKEQYSGIKINEWNQVGNALVYYIPEKGFSRRLLIQLSKQVDVFYLWGCFDVYSLRVLWLKRVGKIKNPVVVASMGLFSPKAFRIKYWKKKPVILILNLLGMFKNIYWSATSKMEVSEIKQQVWSKGSRFFVAEDLPRLVETTPIKKEKQIGKLRVVWISRISPKKNLLQAIRILRKVNAEVEFTIYGPKQELAYWKLCEKELKVLPQNIQWVWAGNVESDEVVSTLKAHHVFLFPTLGENYGHVIQEALSAGCAVILSDQTPWQDLEKHQIGYVFPVDAEQKYINAIEQYAAMDQKQIQYIADKALKYAIDNSNEKVINTGYRNMFDTI